LFGFIGNLLVSPDTYADGNFGRARRGASVVTFLAAVREVSGEGPSKSMLSSNCCWLFLLSSIAVSRRSVADGVELIG